MTHSGPAALAVVKEYLPHVVLLDIGLPGMDGYEVARRLRQEPELDLLIVALTGYGQEEDRRQSQAAGFHHHFVKPVDPPELQQFLAQFCPTSAQSCRSTTEKSSPPAGAP